MPGGPTPASREHVGQAMSSKRVSRTGGSLGRIASLVSVVLAALALRAHRGHGSLRSDEIRSAERLGDPFARGVDDAP